MANLLARPSGRVPSIWTTALSVSPSPSDSVHLSRTQWLSNSLEQRDPLGVPLRHRWRGVGPFPRASEWADLRQGERAFLSAQVTLRPLVWGPRCDNGRSHGCLVSTDDTQQKNPTPAPTRKVATMLSSQEN